MKLHIGNILLIDNQEIYPPKKKINVCVCNDKKFFLLINSANRVKYDCLHIKKSDYPSFLQHDSYISCSRTFNYNETIIKTSKKLGCLSKTDLQRVLDKITNSHTLDKITIKQVAHSLNLVLST